MLSAYNPIFKDKVKQVDELTPPFKAESKVKQ
jgi:hypothetical protein